MNLETTRNIEAQVRNLSKYLKNLNARVHDLPTLRQGTVSKLNPGSPPTVDVALVDEGVVPKVHFLYTTWLPQVNEMCWVFQFSRGMYLAISKITDSMPTDLAATVAALADDVTALESDVVALTDAVAALPRGRVHRGTSSAQYTAITGATIVCNGSPSFSFESGRIYSAVFTIYAASQNDTSSRFNVGFENAASVEYGEQWIGRFLGQASSYTWSTTFTASGFMSMRVRMSRRDGTGNCTLFQGPRNSWSSELLVYDEGQS